MLYHYLPTYCCQELHCQKTDGRLKKKTNPTPTPSAAGNPGNPCPGCLLRLDSEVPGWRGAAAGPSAEQGPHQLPDLWQVWEAALWKRRAKQLGLFSIPSSVFLFLPFYRDPPYKCINSGLLLLCVFLYLLIFGGEMGGMIHWTIFFPTRLSDFPPVIYFSQSFCFVFLLNIQM